MKILIVEPKTLEDYEDEDNWYEFSLLSHYMQLGGFMNGTTNRRN
jgi:hypothetical protein